MPLRPALRRACWATWTRGPLRAVDLDPDRRMVARLVARPKARVDAGGLEPPDERRTHEQMIDAQPGVAGESVAKVIPERVDALGRMERTQRIRPALRDDRLVGRARLGTEQ